MVAASAIIWARKPSDQTADEISPEPRWSFCPQCRVPNLHHAYNKPVFRVALKYGMPQARTPSLVALCAIGTVFHSFTEHSSPYQPQQTLSTVWATPESSCCQFMDSQSTCIKVKRILELHRLNSLAIRTRVVFQRSAPKPLVLKYGKLQMFGIEN